ncbi:MAG: hypothetical protein Q8873_00535 [Bacillota bacterium]|nr:hypothetical protein [Bacillota bacterium]
MSILDKANNQQISQLESDTNFPVTNLVTNGDFSNGTTGWTALSGLAISAVANVLTATLAVSTIGVVCTDLTSAAGTARKVYVRAIVRSRSATITAIDIAIRGSTSATDGTVVAYSKSNPVVNTWYTFSSLTTTSTAATGKDRIIIRPSGAANDAIEVKYVSTIDLTAAFGTGNEPSAAEMDAILAFYPNSWFNGAVNFAANPKLLPYLLNNIRQLNTEKTGYGVYSGLTVSAQSTPDMTVSVATGVIFMENGRRFTPTANTALAVTAADATNPRIDIVYVNSSGVISYLAGTAAASPAAPSVPTGGQKLAEISVAVGAATIVAANIAGCRKRLWADDAIAPTTLGGWVAYDAVGIFKVKKDATGKVTWRGMLKSGTIGSNFALLPVALRPPINMRFPIISNALLGSILVYSDGICNIESGNNTYIDLSSISYFTE